MNSDDHVRQESGSTYGMTDETIGCPVEDCDAGPWPDTYADAGLEDFA